MPSINVDFNETLGRVTPRLYGMGLEHLGACVYGGLWGGQGWRTDVLALARALRPGLLRWPGGNFAQGYHWRDGVGPRRDRPHRFDYYWAKPEPNVVGTHEFLELCELIDAEPSITVNTRTGTPEEAAEWVAYCNGLPHTDAGQQRTANGRTEPFNVKLWAIGSQSWDMGVDEAARRHTAFAAAMKAVDPTITVVAVGGNAANQTTWDRTIVEQARAYLDLLGASAYDGVTTSPTGHPMDVHYANVASAERLLWTISTAGQTVAEALPERADVGVGFDGWGIWRTSRQGLQHDYHLGDGLVAATVLNGLHRLHDRVRFASWGNIVNALGAIQATAHASWTTPVYEVFKLYRRLHGDEVVRSSVAGPAMDVPGGSAPVRAPRPAQPSMPVLDVSATRDRAVGRYTLSVVNRSYDEAQYVDMMIAGLPDGLGAMAHVLTADHVFAANSHGERRRVVPYEVPIGQVGAAYTFPPHSVTLLVWDETPGLT